MKKFGKVLGVFLIVLVIAAISGFIYFNSVYPKVDPPANVKVELTKQRIERGKYLANHVSMCMDCHSTRDWSKYSGPITPGTEGKGGDKYDKELGLPGTIYALNITPASLKNWTDGEIIRTITCGVSKNNNALFPIMPYTNFNKMSKEDVYSIVAYLRTLEPKENNIPERSLDFPVNFIVKTIPPQKYIPAAAPDRKNTVEYGKYLVTIASCGECHSQSNKGEPVPGKEFAGGNEFKIPVGILRPANITPHQETGIGQWTKQQFINRFKAFDSDSAKNITVPMEANTVMPWTLYAGMTEDDLSAIYDYLRTVKPVYNRVVRFTPKGNN